MCFWGLCIRAAVSGGTGLWKSQEAVRTGQSDELRLDFQVPVKILDLYLARLGSHTILAVVIVPLILTTLYRA
jgi:uncharacterized membrane protein YozB (DUF420 family)